MDIKTPDLGVDKAEVIEILCAVGDAIEAGQSLFVVESSKASVEIPSSAAGVVQQVLVKLGDVVSEDVLLLTLADAWTGSGFGVLLGTLIRSPTCSMRLAEVSFSAANSSALNP